MRSSGPCSIVDRLAQDQDGPIDQKLAFDEAPIDTNEGAVLLPHPEPILRSHQSMKHTMLCSLTGQLDKTIPSPIGEAPFSIYL